MAHYINKDALVAKLKNIIRKKFRIINNEVHCPEAFHPYWYRIEQRYTILFFIHWWGTPEFEPPHNFEFVRDAIKHIKEHFPKAIIYDGYSENKCKKIDIMTHLIDKSVVKQAKEAASNAFNSLPLETRKKLANGYERLSEVELLLSKGDNLSMAAIKKRKRELEQWLLEWYKENKE